LKSKKFKRRFSRHIQLINKSKHIQTKEIEEDEKKLLDIFNYYNREYKPFNIEKIHRNHTGENCWKKIQNEKIERLARHQIFSIKKQKNLSQSKVNLALDCYNLFYKNWNILLKANESFLSDITEGTFDICSAKDSMIAYLESFFNYNKFIATDTCIQNKYYFDYIRFSDYFIHEINNRFVFWTDYFSRSHYNLLNIGNNISGNNC
jgi:hypothetical protein